MGRAGGHENPACLAYLFIADRASEGTLGGAAHPVGPPSSLRLLARGLARAGFGKQRMLAELLVGGLFFRWLANVPTWAMPDP